MNIMMMHFFTSTRIIDFYGLRTAQMIMDLLLPSAPMKAKTEVKSKKETQKSKDMKVELVID